MGTNDVDHRGALDRCRGGIAALFAVAVLAVLSISAVAAPQAGAYTYVTQCNYASWPDGHYCPQSWVNPPRHTYVTGRGASAGVHSGHIYSEWYVAYVDSNGSSYKYIFGGLIGNVLYSSMPNNTQLLRAYAYTLGGGTANLFNEGGY